MTDDEARAKVAEYMGWTKCHISNDRWHRTDGCCTHRPRLNDSREGWWEFGQLVEAWKRDNLGYQIRPRFSGKVGISLYSSQGVWGSIDTTWPEAAYRATVKMLEARHD